MPSSLKKKLEQRAKEQRRSLSNQVAHDLERTLAREARATSAPGKLLGLFEGKRVPSEADFAAVRSDLWQRLAGDGDA